MDWKARAEGYRHKIQTQVKNDSSGLQFGMILPGSCVLDVGCACGDMGKALFHEKECRVWGCDYNPYSLQEAEKTGAYERLFPVDLNTFKSVNFPEFQDFFDFIILGDVLEHLLEPAETLLELKHFLKPKGCFVVSIPNIAHISIKMGLLNDEFNYSKTGLLDHTHLRFFTYKTFPSFFGNIGLKIEEVCGSISPPNEEQLKRFPRQCRKIMIKDLHSWVFQYVLRISPSDESVEQLAEWNRQKLDLRKSDLPSEIYFFSDRSHYIKYVYGSFFSRIVDTLALFIPKRGKKEINEDR